MPEINFKTAVLDTCILDYAFKRNTKSQAAMLIEEVSKTYTLVISEYVRFEIFRGLEMGKIPKAKQVVDLFTSYPVDKTVLDIAAALTTCYECDDATKGHRDAFSDGDIIIAATAFKYKLMVITANRNDFPAPYFSESGNPIALKGKKPISIYALKPEFQHLNAMIKACYPKTK